MSVNAALQPRRTHLSNVVFSLPGGNEDNDLWLWREQGPDGTRLRSTWVPTDEQRQAIADGANLELIVWGAGHPPVAIALCNYPLGKAPDHHGG